MPEKLVTYAVAGKVGMVSLNRPDKLNALNREMLLALSECLEAADHDRATSVVVLRGEGRSFCAGFDIADPRYSALHDHPLELQRRVAATVGFEVTPWEMRKPVIASVHGHVLGAGCQIAMLCDLTVAAADAIFGEPEIRFDRPGPALVMPFVVGLKRTRQLLYFGDRIDARTALAWGMVNWVVPLAELAEATLRHADRLALISPEALTAAKLAINRGAEAAGFRDAIRAGMDVLTLLGAGRTKVGEQFFEIARTEGLSAALRWRRSQFGEQGGAG